MKFRIAVIALQRVRDYETARLAYDRCMNEYHRGGSVRSIQLVEKARSLMIAYASQ